MNTSFMLIICFVSEIFSMNNGDKNDLGSRFGGDLNGAIFEATLIIFAVLAIVFLTVIWCICSCLNKSAHSH